MWLHAACDRCSPHGQRHRAARACGGRAKCRDDSTFVESCGHGNQEGLERRESTCVVPRPCSAGGAGKPLIASEPRPTWLVLRWMWQRRFVLEHLSKFAAINPPAAVRTADAPTPEQRAEVLCFGFTHLNPRFSGVSHRTALGAPQ